MGIFMFIKIIIDMPLDSLDSDNQLKQNSFTSTQFLKLIELLLNCSERSYLFCLGNHPLYIYAQSQFTCLVIIKYDQIPIN